MGIGASARKHKAASPLKTYKKQQVETEFCPFCPFNAPLKELSGYKWVMQFVHRTFEHPQDGLIARYWSLLILCMIILSTFSLVLETLPSLQNDPAFNVIEYIVSITFTVEYVPRLIVARHKLKWFVTPLNVIDILAILPFYIELGASGSASFIRVFRVVRLARIFRLLKLARYSKYMSLLSTTVKKSQETLGLLMFYFLIAMVIFSSLVYYAEQGSTSNCAANYAVNATAICCCRSDGNLTPFTSIPATFWWAVVTMFTVGYGDLYPIEPLGKLVGSLTIVCGILVLALPITVVGSNFTEVWNEYRAEKIAEAELAKDLLREQKRQQLIDDHKAQMGTDALVVAASTSCGYCKQRITKQRFKCITCGMNMDSDCLSAHHDATHIVLLIPEGGVNLSSTSEFPHPLGKALEKTIEVTEEEKEGGLKSADALKAQLPVFECENPDCQDGDCTESGRCLSCNIHFCSACSDFHRKDHVQLYLRSGFSESLIVLLAMSFAAAEERKRLGISATPVVAPLTPSTRPTAGSTAKPGDDGAVKVEMM